MLVFQTRLIAPGIGEESDVKINRVITTLSQWRPILRGGQLARLAMIT